MKFIALFLIGLCLDILLPVVSAIAQNESRFDHLTIQDGLSQNQVLSIAQDQQGFLWFGTGDGLNRYDGYTFTIFKKHTGDSTSITSNFVRSLHIDKNGCLWVGTIGGGLNRFDPASQSFQRIGPTDPVNRGLDMIKPICEDSLGNLWIGAYGGGVFRLDASTLSAADPGQVLFSRYRHNPQDSTSLSDDVCYAICADRTGLVWIGTKAGGLNCFDPKMGTFTHDRYRTDDPYSLGQDFVTAILEDRRGDLWVGTAEKGLSRLARSADSDPGTNPRRFICYRNDPANPHSLPHNSITSLWQDRHGVLWIGTFGGLVRLDLNDPVCADPQTAVFTASVNKKNNPASLSNNSVMTVYEDQAGRLWAGTLNGGVNKLDPNSNKARFGHYQALAGEKNALADNDVRAIFVDRRDELWVGTPNGLDRYDKSAQTFAHYTHDPGDGKILIEGIKAVSEDSTGGLWLGSTRGLGRFDPVSRDFEMFTHDPNDPRSLSGNEIINIYVDPKNSVWVGAYGAGLNRFNPDTKDFQHYQNDPNDPGSLSDNFVFALTEDRQGNLWIGTGKGLNVLDQSGRVFKRYVNNPNNLHSLGSDYVNCLYVDLAGTLWIGTSGGLSRWDSIQKAFYNLTEQDGLPNNSVQSILEDAQGNLWLSTNKGICKFNPSAKTFKNYDARDGLQSDGFNARACFKDQSGQMYFGGINGISVFDPQQISDNSYRPPVVLTDFQIFNQTVAIGASTPLTKHISLTDQITLLYHQSVFSFEFAALNFTLPEKNRYAYKMDGFDNDWTYTDARRRFVTYTNLNPGAYIFHVRGSNNDGIWNEQGASVKIVITPPWWKTWWAKTFYVVFFLTSGPSIYFWRVSNLKKRQRRLEQTVRERTAEIVHQKDEIEAKNQKLVEMDHFKQSMMSMIVHDLKNPLSAILNVIESHSVQSQIEMLRHSTRQMLNLVMDILDVQKFEDAKMKLDLDNHVISDLANSAMRQVCFLAERKNIVIRCEIPTQLAMTCDRELVERALVNLLTNAIKFTSNNGRINLSARNDIFQKNVISTDSSFVRIEVHDSGDGIPSDKLELIFSRFGQVEAKKSGGVRSTGLGLTFCKLAIEAHGGRVGVESEVGKGATFWFTLRQAQPAQATIAEAKSPADDLALARMPLFIFDDDERQALANFLAELRKLQVYEISAIRKVLKSVEVLPGGNIAQWSAELKKTIYAGNEEHYKELLNI